jgi:hypothetical protein
VRERADRDRIDRLLRALGRRLRRPVRLYLVGGAIVVDRGLRQSTLDPAVVVDLDGEIAALHCAIRPTTSSGGSRAWVNG